MISKEKFEEIFKYEYESISRNNLYIMYNYLNTVINNLEENFELQQKQVWRKENHPYKWQRNDEIDEEYYKKIGVLDYIYNYSSENSFWMLTGLVNKIDFSYIRKNYLTKDKSSINRYIDLILNHLIPKNKEYVDLYIQKLAEKSVQNKEINNKQKINGGIYGIYENGELVYIGMTMRPFEERWKEHQSRIKARSNELALYNLIDINSKIEFKKILERNNMESDSEITKRDLQAMEFALIQEHKPKYNLAGNSYMYRFS